MKKYVLIYVVLAFAFSVLNTISMLNGHWEIDGLESELFMAWLLPIVIPMGLIMVLVPFYSAFKVIEMTNATTTAIKKAENKKDSFDDWESGAALPRKDISAGRRVIHRGYNDSDDGIFVSAGDGIVGSGIFE